MARFASDDQHREAREAILIAFPRVVGRDPNLPEQQILQANASLESSYCRGTYKLLDHATGEPIAKSGVIWNCGAVQTDDPSHGFLATDTSPSKVTPENPKGYYDHLYRVFPDLASGLERMIHEFVIRRPTSWAYARQGDLDRWSEEAHAEKLPGGKVKIDPETKTPGYFEQSPPKRAEGVMMRIEEFAPVLGEPIEVRRGGPFVDAVTGASGVANGSESVSSGPSPLFLITGGGIVGTILYGLVRWFAR